MKNKLFRNKYRIASARAPWWDYRTSAPYFITICTKKRRYLFGYIKEGEMHLNDLGHKAWECWYEIPEHFPFVELINFVVMPNHVHGLLHLHNDFVNGKIDDSSTVAVVDTLHATYLQSKPPEPLSPKNESMAIISPKKGSLSTVIRSYKSAVTQYANDNGLQSGWQERFHDHIVRDEKEFKRIFDYITNNPRNWNGDKFYDMET